MNKKELVKIVAAEAGETEKMTEAVIKALHATIVSEVAKGEKVQFVGFGTFTSRKRTARTGRNPQTGKAVKIEAATVPGFKAGKAFKEAVNVKPAKGRKKK